MHPPFPPINMADNTAVLLIDPMNEFLHPDGKLYPRLKESLETTDTVRHMYALIKAARDAKVPIFYCQHKLNEDGHFHGWNHMSKSLLRIEQDGAFKQGSFGGEIFKDMGPDRQNGDVVVSRHWNSR